jgi:RNA polymerase sigma-70 factor (ECF subfamily)
MTGDAALELFDVDALEGRARQDAKKRDHAANRAMDRYAAGDASAFADLYDALAPRLYGFLIRQLRNATLAEDVLQQVMLQIHCARASYMSGAQVVPWAFAIARNLAVDSHRRGRREIALDVDDPANERPSLDPMPDDVLRAKQAAHTLERVLAEIPESQRIAFELLKYDGLSLAEAAEVLGISVGAVKVRAHRTYAALRAALNDGATDEECDEDAR